MIKEEDKEKNRNLKIIEKTHSIAQNGLTIHLIPVLRTNKTILKVV